MFPIGNLTIKNEPIKAEDFDIDTSDKSFLLPTVVIKCERDFVPDSSDTIGRNYDGQAQTTICSESEYLAEGNVAFESIIVKEEERLNIREDIANALDAGSVSSDIFKEKLVKKFECYICGYEPFSIVDLRKHVNAHIDKRRGISQEHVSGGGKHELVHKEKKLFACDQCDRKFLRKSTLKQHQLIHSGIKRFACDECDRKFSDPSAFARHRQTHSGERPFGCDLCDQRCSRKSTLLRHLQTHSGYKSFVCDVCDKRFSRNSTLNHHKLIHTGENPFECDQCDRKFKIKSSLAYHLLTHGEKQFSCDDCGRKYVTKVMLNQHKKVHKSGEKQTMSSDQCHTAVVIKRERDFSPDPGHLIGSSDSEKPKTAIFSESEYLADEENVEFESIIVKEEYKCGDHGNFGDVGTEEPVKNLECYICCYGSGNIEGLRNHIKTHIDNKFSKKRRSRTHNSGLEKRFACDQCDKRFAVKSSLYKHKVVHNGEKLFSCDQCDRKCLRKSTLKQHKLIHSGIKPFACDECDRKFADSSTLYKHKQTHSNERPFVCQLCDRRCSRKATLDRHLKTHTGEKSFVCDICDKRFSRNSTLNHHKFIHTGENPFECDQCDKKFKMRSTLTFHMQTHSNERKFDCDKCDKNFKTRPSLNQHKKTHNAIKEFSCDQCPKAYTDKTTLSRHKAVHQKSPTSGEKVVKVRTNRQQSKYSILMKKCKSLRKI